MRHAKAVVNGSEQSVHEAVKDDNWLKNEFITVSVFLAATIMCIIIHEKGKE